MTFDNIVARASRPRVRGLFEALPVGVQSQFLNLSWIKAGSKERNSSFLIPKAIPALLIPKELRLWQAWPRQTRWRRAAEYRIGDRVLSF